LYADALGKNPAATSGLLKFAFIGTILGSVLLMVYFTYSLACRCPSALATALWWYWSLLVLVGAWRKHVIKVQHYPTLAMVMLNSLALTDALLCLIAAWLASKNTLAVGYRMALTMFAIPALLGFLRFSGIYPLETWHPNP
jgi:hypothetical protein